MESTDHCVRQELALDSAITTLQTLRASTTISVVSGGHSGTNPLTMTFSSSMALTRYLYLFRMGVVCCAGRRLRTSYCRTALRRRSCAENETASSKPLKRCIVNCAEGLSRFKLAAKVTERALPEHCRNFAIGTVDAGNSGLQESLSLQRRIAQPDEVEVVCLWEAVEESYQMISNVVKTAAKQRSSELITAVESC
jgi:hypothetical protein